MYVSLLLLLFSGYWSNDSVKYPLSVSLSDWPLICGIDGRVLEERICEKTGDNFVCMVLTQI